MSPDGGSGSILEHSVADGIASMQLDVYVLKAMYVVTNHHVIVIVIITDN